METNFRVPKKQKELVCNVVISWQSLTSIFITLLEYMAFYFGYHCLSCYFRLIACILSILRKVFIPKDSQFSHSKLFVTKLS